VIHVTGTPRSETRPPPMTTAIAPGASSWMSGAPGRPASPTPVPPSRPNTTLTDPHEVIVGPNSISNRYKLLSVDRKPRSRTSDDLTVKLHVESLAMENLVSPFESGMLDLQSPGLAPVHPRNPFRSPLPSGSTRNQEIVFSIPTTLNLNHATLQIHYYNYQNEIPLDLPATYSDTNPVH